ncbi:glycosyltransferase [Providencia sp. JGM181]|uniref:ATP-grasp fold amidoligase family protein n=1 Tax=unclassified Providencia TaxID=2633465 RepID=UPI001BADD94B|nr:MULTISPECIES: ATP-grasp fold amidoligase family protein [unclassified Providencia]MBS0926179.1 glycosyltransferase [Providencia sp. JGM181]MBS0933285.1 glycosyltransferase [Providencia sp. JGM172]MBS0998734.1 glycosyltransferase [Providencia sp. JGM178]
MKKTEYFLKKFRALIMSDKSYLTNKFIKKLGYYPNFNAPKSFNEKVNFRMIHDRNPLHSQFADKLAVRDYVTQTIGQEHIVPILATYQHVDEIDITKLPQRFVLKCTHDSGSSIICTDKSQFDLQKAKDKLSFHLLKNLYYITRERHYKNIPAQIICEEYIDLFEQKKRKLVPETCRIHCFSGKPVYAEIDYTDEDGTEFINLYDTEWQLQPVSFGYPQMLEPVSEPTQFREMLRLAEILVTPFDYCRADFLMAENKLYFSELTFAPNAGRTVISPLSWDFKLGELWEQKITTPNMLHSRKPELILANLNKKK